MKNIIIEHLDTVTSAKPSKRHLSLTPCSSKVRTQLTATLTVSISTVSRCDLHSSYFCHPSSCPLPAQPPIQNSKFQNPFTLSLTPCFSKVWQLTDYYLNGFNRFFTHASPFKNQNSKFKNPSKRPVI